MNLDDIGKDNTTSSPWIYNELLIAKTFPTRCPQDYGILKAERSDSIEHFGLTIKYNVALTDFINITLDDIKQATNKAKEKGNRNVLDQLYLEKGLIVSDTLVSR